MKKKKPEPTKYRVKLTYPSNKKERKIRFTLMLAQDWLDKGAQITSGLIDTNTTNLTVLRKENRLDRIWMAIKARVFILKHLT